MKIKFRKENVIFGIVCGLILMVIFPFIAFLSPSIAESMYPSYGECDIYYKDVFYPCMSASEVFKINITLGIIAGIIFFLIIIFTDIKN